MVAMDEHELELRRVRSWCAPHQASRLCANRGERGKSGTWQYETPCGKRNAGGIGGPSRGAMGDGE
jgi:hypothetical protein